MKLGKPKTKCYTRSIRIKKEDVDEIMKLSKLSKKRGQYLGELNFNQVTTTALDLLKRVMCFDVVTVDVHARHSSTGMTIAERISELINRLPKGTAIGIESCVAQLLDLGIDAYNIASSSGQHCVITPEGYTEEVESENTDLRNLVEKYLSDNPDMAEQYHAIRSKHQHLTKYKPKQLPATLN